MRPMNTATEDWNGLGVPKGSYDAAVPLLSSYAAASTLSNEQLYATLSEKQGLPECHWARRVPIGKSGKLYSQERRSVRWIQQTLRELGLIERVPGQRGVWRATEKLKEAAPVREALHVSPSRWITLGYSTKLGVALWADSSSVFSHLGEPIHLMLSSLPYPLQNPRAYGGPTQHQYVDWTCNLLEPIVRYLAPGGTIVLNVSNDVFMPGSPARSSYRERLVIALEDRLSLFKLDEMIWLDRTKVPGPIAWASKERIQLNTAWEPIYAFTNDPHRSLASNLRVLQPHTEQQLRLIASGGTNRHADYGDGANRLRPGAFSNPTPGRIPRNVLEFPHRCPSQIQMRRALRLRGLPMHGATMPLALAKFLVQYFTKRGDLVCDPTAGWFTSALAAEQSHCRWIATDHMLEYVAGSQLRFNQAPGFNSMIELPSP